MWCIFLNEVDVVIHDLKRTGVCDSTWRHPIAEATQQLHKNNARISLLFLHFTTDKLEELEHYTDGCFDHLCTTGKKS